MPTKKPSKKRDENGRFTSSKNNEEVSIIENPQAIKIKEKKRKKLHL